ncbi:Rho termination factor N-terminal domain-containing protein [Geminocystis sp. NIES-3709]|uniref:Rho termination factor N-terminal domain-containing protein n=1 Tax=Geminocystis sp. NIES-3709 TaxID=1617448 RepID=UPI0005FC6D3C|nr:Rho termination factor N-terminal domain-containing protein [Geminocystis sp. NIES-3709]BAQ63469.1 hypothetical protein GM3709_234 [Geminocystis sp. NIES-3709]
MTESLPNNIIDVNILRTMTAVNLKAMAKKRGIVGISKMKKDDLIKVLSEKNT